MAGDALIVEVNDALVRVQHGATSLHGETGYATVENGKVVQTGDASRADAKRHPRRTINDFWHRLSTDTLETVALTRADLVAAQIQVLLPPEQYANRNVVLLLPGALPREQLGLLLGVFKACDLNVIGLIDTASAASRLFYRDQTLLHVDVSLHAATVSRISQDAQSSKLDDVRAVEGSGLHNLYEEWMTFFASQFVRQCRFDPLHSADAEQKLFDLLPAWLREIGQNDELELTFSHAGHSHTITVVSVDVINVVAAHYQRIADVARALTGGASAPALQLRFAAASLPGFAQMLCARAGGSFFTIDDDAAIRHAAAVLPTLSLSDSRVLSEMPVDGESASTVATEQRSDDVPTHLVLDARAYALTAQPLTLGSGTEHAPDRYLQLDGSPAGVSGVHCDIRLDVNQCLVVDHSRYGTFLNGNRISASAALRIGDILRVGTPGREMQLIRLEAM
ncbi:MAG: FHA domain-containing protein [Pseudomonadota bacterium]